jgi:hypothetical protein
VRGGALTVLVGGGTGFGVGAEGARGGALTVLVGGGTGFGVGAEGVGGVRGPVVGGGPGVPGVGDGLDLLGDAASGLSGDVGADTGAGSASDASGCGGCSP